MLGARAVANTRDVRARPLIVPGNEGCKGRQTQPRLLAATMATRARTITTGIPFLLPASFSPSPLSLSPLYRASCVSHPLSRASWPLHHHITSALRQPLFKLNQSSALHFPLLNSAASRLSEYRGSLILAQNYKSRMISRSFLALSERIIRGTL